MTGWSALVWQCPSILPSVASRTLFLSITLHLSFSFNLVLSLTCSPTCMSYLTLVCAVALVASVACNMSVYVHLLLPRRFRGCSVYSNLFHKYKSTSSTASTPTASPTVKGSSPAKRSSHTTLPPRPARTSVTRANSEPRPHSEAVSRTDAPASLDTKAHESESSFLGIPFIPSPVAIPSGMGATVQVLRSSSDSHLATGIAMGAPTSPSTEGGEPLQSQDSAGSGEMSTTGRHPVVRRKKFLVVNSAQTPSTVDSAGRRFARL
jgi:hypothetical protein